jgi:serine/threonine protein kinase/Tol biopolymer transport system component
MSPQQTIAHYRITSKLGEGGMGEVWRATDTKLSRDVAIKILPAEFAADPDRLDRFTREAQVLASLNHPNIAAIYGVEESALVMELVEGQTLAERIAQGPIPPDEAIAIARQIAEALEYAHEHGVIHRDLKPANIKVTPDRRVKVLDFGLAKAISGESVSGDPVNSPTLTMRATMAGVIVGTAAYMAPEQARGQVVDRRADIWAFGVVLYEMLAGRRLFEAPTISDTLAAVLRAEPDWSALPGGLPGNISTLLRRCLERDSCRRLRDIGDARLELEQPTAVPAVPSPAPRLRRLPWIGTAAMSIAAAVLAIVHFRETPPAAPPTVRFSILPPEKSTFAQWMALSPDGRYLAFTATGTDSFSRVWVRSLDSLEMRAVAETENTTVITFFWTPDSRSIIFQSGAKIRKVDVAGGAPHSLGDARGTMLNGSGNGTGVVLFGSNNGPVYRISSSGGPSTPLTRIEPSRNETYHTDPIFLPDGIHFLYFRHSSKPEFQGVYVGSIENKPEAQSLARIQPVDLSPGFAPPRDGSTVGHLLQVREGSLLATPFDLRRLEIVGEPVPIAEQVGSNITRAFFSVSGNGVLVYRSGSSASEEIGWFDRQGRPLGTAVGSGVYQDLALSPDGSRLAYNRTIQGSVYDIWVLDIARAIHTRLTFIPEGARGPAWSPDGRSLAFSAVTGPAMYIQDVATGGAARQIFQASAVSTVSNWTGDGRFLLYTQTTGAFDVMALSNPSGGGERKPIPVANSEFGEMQGQVSPDSRYVAYYSGESGRYEIYVRPFPPGDGNTGKWLVSTSGGAQPRWRRDGAELYYIAADRTLMAVEVKTQPMFQSGTPHPLFPVAQFTMQSPAALYDVTPDGKRFVVISPGREMAGTPATVVLNWEAALKK